MTKVLQISNYMFPHIGGIEQVARDIAKALGLLGHIEQKIICFNETAASGDYVCKRGETVYDTVDGVSVIRCGCILKVRSQSLSLTYPRELKKVISDFQPDTVIFHYPNPFVAHFLLRYQNLPFKLVLFWHLDITKQQILKKLFHRQTLRLVRRADIVVGATPMHVDESAYTEYFRDKKAVLPYPVNQERLLISSEEMETAAGIRARYPGKVLALFSGRHVPYKGLKYLIEASRYLNGNMHLFIGGRGELTGKLMQQAAGDEKIEFLGRISDSQWRSYLYACDVFCLPSITRNEGFGLVLTEAMYFGKPAVTFTIPGSGVNYVNLNGVTGIECPNRDSKAYAAAIQLLADDPVLREEYGNNGRRRVLEHFTEAQFTSSVKALINSLLAQRNPGAGQKEQA